jgi:hypothetical protein
MTDGQDLQPAGDFSLTPEQASAKLAEMGAAYKGATPETPKDATAARARIDALSNSPEFYSKLMKGSVQARKEWDHLNQLIANDAGGPTGIIETVDAISDPSALRAAAREALFDGLQASGLPDSGVDYVEGLDRGERADRPTEGDGVAAREILERLSKNSRWHDRIFKEQDPAAIEAMTRLSSVVALAAQDGEPVTPVVSQYIANLTERHK